MQDFPEDHAIFQLIDIDRLGQELGSAVLTFGP